MLKLHGLASLSALIACAGIAMVAADAGPASGQQPPRELPEEAVRIIELIRAGEATNEGFATPPPCCVIDDEAPAVAIPVALARMQALLDASDRGTRRHVETALASLQDAWSTLHRGVGERGHPGDLSYLNETLILLRRSALALELAELTARNGEATEVQVLLANVAERMATDVFEVARSAGISERRLASIQQILARASDSRDSGRYVVAISQFGSAVNFGGNAIDFDIDGFIQNFRDVLDDQTIGYTYAVTLFDTLYESDASGEARIPPDLFPEAQDPGKEMQVASVSKTLTAIVVLWLLEENGLSPDDPVGPWLPPDWERGEGVDEQTFRDYLTHRTGYGQKGVDQFFDTTYADLQTAISIDVPGNTSYAYNNSNFAIFRVIVPRLAGFDLEAFPEYDDDELAAGLFVYTALNFFEAVDVAATCNPNEPNPTIYYSFPHNDFNGLHLVDMSLECGGYGFFLSSEDLAAILSDLAVDDELLSDASFQLMKEGFLGFKDPADGWFWGNGGLGIYHNHSGLWQAGIKGLAACVMLFPNGVTATVTINSLGGAYPNQCEVLRAAFDAAWVPG